MMSFVCISTAQIVGFIILLVAACAIIGFCGILRKKITEKSLLNASKLTECVNLDAEDESEKVEGVSLLAKRKYIVSEQNKIKPISYTLVEKENAVILVNNVKVTYKSGDVIEFKDGDTVSAIDQNVMLAY